MESTWTKSIYERFRHRMSFSILAVQNPKPDPGNARRYSARQVRQILGSIAAFGFNAPLLVDEDLNVIAGHGRMAAANRGLCKAPG